MPVAVPATRRTWEMDIEALIDGARGNIAANATVQNYCKGLPNDPDFVRIYNGTGEEGAKTPFIVLALNSPVDKSRYNEPAFSVLLDIGAYYDGWSTEIVRSLMVACIKAVVTDSWTATGFVINAKSLDGAGTSGPFWRIADEVISKGKMRRGRQITVRLEVSKE